MVGGEGGMDTVCDSWKLEQVDTQPHIKCKTRDRFISSGRTRNKYTEFSSLCLSVNCVGYK